MKEYSALHIYPEGSKVNANNNAIVQINSSTSAVVDKFMWLSDADDTITESESRSATTTTTIISKKPNQQAFAATCHFQMVGGLWATEKIVFDEIDT
jgi:hypothetical protein